MDAAVTATVDAGYIVAVDNVSFVHKRGRVRTTILRQFSHVFHSGTMTGICGPSGCGKSTLLKLLAQVHTPESGIIRINGAPPSEESRRQTSYLPQDDILPRYLRVREVFQHHSTIRRIPRQSQESSALLETLGLEHFAESRIGQLSGGQRKRVSIGLELLRKPRLLLLDEPTASLDSENAKIVMELLSAVRTSQVTIVMITHRTEDLKACDHHLGMMQAA